MNALEIKNLTKSFPGFKLDDLNLTLPSGCIMGLIGENGAGKSTTIKLILDMIHKDEGSVIILGNDNQDRLQLVKEDIGVVLDEVGLPDCLTARHIGKVMSNIFHNWNDTEYKNLLDKFSLPDNKKFKEFSRGMKMKLAVHSICLILFHSFQFYSY
ncbi:MAG: ATP-binding cassette domain-containing protein [Lachnospiraceae bacterium]|nr:ATP-binding cassette domain-containing protein [Lachnospiraceae bacterium]